MSMPGFSAEASLLPSMGNMEVVALLYRSAPQSIVPARTFGPPPPNCTTTCSPQCDSNCRRSCTTKCTPGGTVTSFEPCCGDNFTCQNGSCVCLSPNQLCGSACTDISSDNFNCGQCGNECSADQTCQMGGCFPTPVVCGPCTNGSQTCCSFTAPDVRLCGVGTCCPSGQASCMVNGSPGCVTPGPPYPVGNLSWCGSSSYGFGGPFQGDVVSCGCPTGFTCGSVCSGQLCTVDWYCQPN
jgi:hypothetical protein